MSQPLTLRYNNPGAVEFKPWMGAYGATLGPNGRYAQFETPDQGYSVMGRILDTYQNKHGLNTVSGIVNRWAPADVDNNSTGSYINSVSRRLGIDPNAPLAPERTSEENTGMTSVPMNKLFLLERPSKTACAISARMVVYDSAIVVLNYWLNLGTYSTTSPATPLLIATPRVTVEALAYVPRMRPLVTAKTVLPAVTIADTMPNWDGKKSLTAP